MELSFDEFIICLRDKKILLDEIFKIFKEDILNITLLYCNTQINDNLLSQLKLIIFFIFF